MLPGHSNSYYTTLTKVLFKQQTFSSSQLSKQVSYWTNCVVCSWTLIIQFISSFWHSLWDLLYVSLHQVLRLFQCAAKKLKWEKSPSED